MNPRMMLTSPPRSAINHFQLTIETTAGTIQGTSSSHPAKPSPGKIQIQEQGQRQTRYITEQDIEERENEAEPERMIEAPQN